MNNQPNKMAGISALPVVIILGLVIVAGYFLMSGDVKLFDQDKSIEMRRLEGFPTTVNVNEDIAKQRLVIKSEEELINFLSSIDKSDQLSVQEKINFEKEMLIAVSSKTNNTDGYDLKIRKIYIDREENSLLVSALSTQPGDSCTITQTLTVNVDIVAVDKTEMPVDFENLTQTEFCEE